jgi:hypothetical protein
LKHYEFMTRAVFCFANIIMQTTVAMTVRLVKKSLKNEKEKKKKLKIHGS